MEILLVLLILLLLAGIIGIIIVANYLSHTNHSLEKISNKLASHNDALHGGTVLLPVTKMDPKAECNTVLPLPLGSEMCNHTMDVITKEVIRAPHEERAIVILQCTKCGVMDKTIAVTSPPPKPPPEPPPPKSECRHNWVKEKTVTLDSAFEQMEDFLKQNAFKKIVVNKNGKKGEEVEKVIFDAASAPSWMFQKKCLKERICSKCGDIDRVLSSNFEVEENEEIETN